MALTNYGELKTAVATRLVRSNLTSQIVDFIAIAHFKMMRGEWHGPMGPRRTIPALRLQDMLESATLTPSDGAASTPTGYLAARRLYVDDAETTALRYIPPEKWYSLTTEGQGGTPRFYTIEAGTFRFAPYSTETVSLDYYKELDALSDDSDTNSIFTIGPQAYLYGALAEAYDHIRQHDRAINYHNMFAATVEALNGQTREHEHSGAVMVATVDNPV